MTTDQLTMFTDGIIVGVDVALLVRFGGQIWNDFLDRRAVRRHATALEERTETQ